MSLRIVHCEIKVIPYGTYKNRYIIVRRMQLDANEDRAFSRKCVVIRCDSDVYDTYILYIILFFKFYRTFINILTLIKFSIIIY